LHQPASIDVVRAAQGQNQAIADAMMTPLLVMAGAYGAAFAALLFAAMRAEIYRRRALAKSTRRAMS
jgi:ABC-type transport system involved in cytochrome c biogenesis permease subunit